MALSKKNRLGAKAIADIFKHGISVQGPHVTLRFVRTGKGDRAVVPIVPKSFSLSAVKRNKARRVILEELRGLLENVQEGVFGVVLLKKTESPSREDIRREVLALLEKSAIVNK